MYLYVSGKKGVYKIPKSKYNENYDLEFKKVKEFANEKVILITLFYETLNRKPYKLELVSFHRAQLDKDGGYAITQKVIDDTSSNFFNYAFCDADDLAKRETIAIPVAPDNIPTEEKKKALYTYLNKKYPIFMNDCPYFVEKNIKEIEDHYNELKELFKAVYKKKIASEK